MSTESQAPTLHFFRRIGDDVLANPPLASSLQSLETCFILISFGRYPHALLACASAIESAIRAKLKRPPEDETTLTTLLEEIRSRFPALRRLFDGGKLADFRRVRNRIIHYGFSPADDDKSTRLLIQTGLPFLRKCYLELFGFYLDWHEIRPGSTAFADLSEDEKKSVWLNPGLADQLRVASDVFFKVKDLGGVDASYCFESFGHFVRLWVQAELISATRTYPLLKNDEHPCPGFLDPFPPDDCDNIDFSRNDKLEKRKREIERKLDTPWPFDCPTCGGADTVVADLDDPSLDRWQVVVSSATCVSCGLFISKNWRYLAARLFSSQAPLREAAIFKELGHNLPDRAK